VRRERRYVALALGVTLGSGLWLLWADVLDRGLPLDGGAPYLGALFLAGALLALIDLDDPWPGPLGLYAGQALGLTGDAFVVPGGERHLLPLRLLYLVSISLAAVLGAALSAAVRLWIQGVPRAH